MDNFEKATDRAVKGTELGRYRSIKITPEALLNFFGPNGGIPASATIKSANYSIDHNIFTIIIEDESFEAIKSGDVIPGYDTLG
ncbi:hypothetical protein LCGC14_2591310 [marine sediment metagenome]|uniref:Uncharacterized protein n=1 Tax=marine sediment metagenome TaxID=412755 RepID=A0A0F9ABJ0_9ZZZZ